MVLSNRLPQLPLRDEKAHVTDYLIATDQEIPDLAIKITFLEKVETAIRSGIRSRFAL